MKSIYFHHAKSLSVVLVDGICSFTTKVKDYNNVNTYLFYRIDPDRVEDNISLFQEIWDYCKDRAIFFIPSTIIPALLAKANASYTSKSPQHYIPITLSDLESQQDRLEANLREVNNYIATKTKAEDSLCVLLHL